MDKEQTAVEQIKNVTKLAKFFGLILLAFVALSPFVCPKLTYFDTLGIAMLVAIIIVCAIDYAKCDKEDYPSWKAAINTYEVIILMLGAIIAVLLYIANLFSFDPKWVNDANYINMLITAIISIFAAEEGAKSFFKTEKNKNA